MVPSFPPSVGQRFSFDPSLTKLARRDASVSALIQAIRSCNQTCILKGTCESIQIFRLQQSLRLQLCGAVVSRLSAIMRIEFGGFFASLSVVLENWERAMVQCERW